MHDGSGRIVVQGLSKSFGPVQAVQDLSFTVEPGTVTGFLGPNGSGKTTTLRMILGLVKPTAGTATINGVPFHQLPNPGTVVGAVLEAVGTLPQLQAYRWAFLPVLVLVAFGSLGQWWFRSRRVAARRG